MPLYSTISYNGCTSVNQAIAYTIGMKVGLSLKVLTIILLLGSLILLCNKIEPESGLDLVKD